jgi:hypothetical protein
MLLRRPLRPRLLGIDLVSSHAFQHEISKGCEGLKPGWIRMNVNHFLSEATCDYLIDAVHLIADQGWKLLTVYTFEPRTGLWHHRAAPLEPPLRLSAVHYDPDGVLQYPRAHLNADERPPGIPLPSPRAARGPTASRVRR